MEFLLHYWQTNKQNQGKTAYCVLSALGIFPNLSLPSALRKAVRNNELQKLHNSQSEQAARQSTSRLLCKNFQSGQSLLPSALHSMQAQADGMSYS